MFQLGRIGGIDPALPGPAASADLPPPARAHRSPPDHRVRRPGRQPLDRKTTGRTIRKIRPRPGAWVNGATQTYRARVQVNSAPRHTERSVGMQLRQSRQRWVADHSGGSCAPAVDQRSSRSVIQRRARVVPVEYERPNLARAAWVLARRSSASAPTRPYGGRRRCDSDLAAPPPRHGLAVLLGRPAPGALRYAVWPA
jgi:hypothetical protein